MPDKKIYICGDSFCVEDIEYGLNWVNILKNKNPQAQVTNLSSVGASNYLIYLQVKQAIDEGADHIIYNATSSIRQELAISYDSSVTDHAERYYNHSKPNLIKPMMSSTWSTTHQLDQKLVSNRQLDEINNFFKQYLDLPMLIEKSYIFISHTLQLLSSSDLVSWAWSRGGFEHPLFVNNTAASWDFSMYQKLENQINLWDYYTSGAIRPYYHIVDDKIHRNYCNNFENLLQLH